MKCFLHFVLITATIMMSSLTSEACYSKRLNLLDATVRKATGETTLKAFQEVKELFDKFLTYREKQRSSLQGGMLPLLAIISRVHGKLKTDLSKSLPNVNNPSIDAATFAIHAAVAKHALNIYWASFQDRRSEQAEELHLQSESDILYTRFLQSEELSPKHAVFLDRSLGAVILAIRGTQSLKDVVIDGLASKEDFLGGFAHQGILNSSKEIISNVQEIIRDALEDNPGYELIITGHSLGGGAAVLTTMEFIARKKKYFGGKDIKISCVALAPPPVFGPNHTSLIENFDKSIHIYVNNNDIVPHLGLATVANLYEEARAVDATQLNPVEKASFVFHTNSEENMDKVMAASLKAKQGEYVFLRDPVTKVKYFHEVDRSRTVLVDVDEDVFSDRIWLLKRAVLDHRKGAYRRAFDSVTFD